MDLCFKVINHCQINQKRINLGRCMPVEQRRWWRCCFVTKIVKMMLRCKDDDSHPHRNIDQFFNVSSLRACNTSSTTIVHNVTAYENLKRRLAHMGKSATNIYGRYWNLSGFFLVDNLDMHRTALPKLCVATILGVAHSSKGGGVIPRLRVTERSCYRELLKQYGILMNCRR